MSFWLSLAKFSSVSKFLNILMPGFCNCCWKRDNLNKTHKTNLRNNLRKNIENYQLQGNCFYFIFFNFSQMILLLSYLLDNMYYLRLHLSEKKRFRKWHKMATFWAIKDKTFYRIAVNWPSRCLDHYLSISKSNNDNLEKWLLLSVVIGG